LARVDALLNAFQARSSVATAFQNVLLISYEEFQRQWIESFEQHRS
jgi:hypothetical protein